VTTAKYLKVCAKKKETATKSERKRKTINKTFRTYTS